MSCLTKLPPSQLLVRLLHPLRLIQQVAWRAGNLRSHDPSTPEIIIDEAHVVFHCPSLSADLDSELPHTIDGVLCSVQEAQCLPCRQQVNVARQQLTAILPLILIDLLQSTPRPVHSLILILRVVLSNPLKKHNNSCSLASLPFISGCFRQCLCCRDSFIPRLLCWFLPSRVVEHVSSDLSLVLCLNGSQLCTVCLLKLGAATNPPFSGSSLLQTG